MTRRGEDAAGEHAMERRDILSSDVLGFRAGLGADDTTGGRGTSSE